MPEQVTSPEADYRVIARGEYPSPQDIATYWSLVKRALRDVFEVDDDAPVNALRDKVNAQNADTQTVFYHADPFEVAADLAGQRGKVITADEKARYIDKVKKLRGDKRPSGEQLEQDPPEH